MHYSEIHLIYNYIMYMNHTGACYSMPTDFHILSNVFLKPRLTKAFQVSLTPMRLSGGKMRKHMLKPEYLYCGSVAERALCLTQGRFMKTHVQPGVEYDSTAHINQSAGSGTKSYLPECPLCPTPRTENKSPPATSPKHRDAGSEGGLNKNVNTEYLLSAPFLYLRAGEWHSVQYNMLCLGFNSKDR